jgi:hypothetical protein
MTSAFRGQSTAEKRTGELIATMADDEPTSTSVHMPPQVKPERWPCGFIISTAARTAPWAARCSTGAA